MTYQTHIIIFLAACSQPHWCWCKRNYFYKWRHRIKQYCGEGIESKIFWQQGLQKSFVIAQPGFACSNSTMETPEKLFRVNNKDTRTTSMTYWCLYRWLLTGFTHCSGVSIADTEQVNTSFLCFSKATKLCLKVVSATFLLVCFACLKESTCKTRRNAFISRQNLFSFFR